MRLAALAFAFVVSTSPRVERAFYRVTFGNETFALELHEIGSDVSGQLRFGSSTDDLPLQCKLKPGTHPEFQVVELTALSSGKPVGTLTAHLTEKFTLQDARWLPSGAKNPVPAALESLREYPARLKLGGAGKLAVSLVPQERVSKQPHCSDQLEYPALAGAADAKKQSALNAGWKKNWGTPSCRGGPGAEKVDPPYEYSTSYQVLTHVTGRFIGLRFTAFNFEGGFHGQTTTRCEVLDLETLTTLRLGDSLTDEGRQALGKKVSELLKKPVEIEKGENLCLEDDVIAVDFRDYEVTTHAEGPPYVKVPKGLFEDWLKRDPELDALFGRGR